MFTDQNCLDIAINYGDVRIIGLLMAKFSRKDKEKPTLKTPSSAQEKVNGKNAFLSIAIVWMFNELSSVFVDAYSVTSTIGFSSCEKRPERQYHS